MGFTAVLLLSLYAVGQVFAGQLSVQNPRLTVLGQDASTVRSETLSASSAEKPSPITLGPTETLKLTFTVIAKEKGEVKGVQPHQSFLRFFDKKSGEEGIVPVRVTNTGKAKFELNMARPPSSLPPTPLTEEGVNPLTVSLIVGSFEHESVSSELFDVILPPSQPAPEHPDEKTFHPQPEIFHTFRPDQKVPSKFVSGLGAIAVGAAPWILLFGFLSQIPLSTSYFASPSILPFTLSLTAFEGLLFWYWVDLKLGEVLAYGAALGLVTVISGKIALEKRGVWRVQGVSKK